MMDYPLLEQCHNLKRGCLFNGKFIFVVNIVDTTVFIIPK